MVFYLRKVLDFDFFDVSADDSVFFIAIIILKRTLLAADEEIFKVCLIQLVFLHHSVHKVLDLKVWECCGKIDDAASDREQRQVDFFVLKSILPYDWHRD